MNLADKINSDLKEAMKAKNNDRLAALRAIKSELLLAKTAGSDTHFGFEIGKAYTEFQGNLRTALKNKKTKIKGSTKKSIIGRMLSLIVVSVKGPKK